MKKIIYNEPYYDPYTHKYDYTKMTQYTVECRTPEEYTAHRAAILNPERGITLIDPPELPEVPDSAWFPPVIEPIEQLRADADYIAMMGGIDL